MQRQVVQPKREEKGPLVQIKLGGAAKSAGAAGGFKKGGFKNAFGAGVDEVEDKKEKKNEVDVEMQVEAAQDLEAKVVDDVDSDVTDEEDYYDPRQPTGCSASCKSHLIVAT